MRYHLKFEGSVVAESEYADLAEAAATHSPVVVEIYDTWKDEYLPVPPKPKPPVAPPVMPDGTIEELINVHGKKITAIKLIRELTGWSLAESKAYADHIQYGTRA